MTGTQIIRGFRRLGIVMAIPCFIASAAYLSIGVYEDWVRKDEWAAFPDRPPPRAKLDGQPFKTKPVDHDPFADLIPKRSVVRDVAPFAAGIAGLGVALFFACWLVGWMFAGFVRD